MARYLHRDAEDGLTRTQALVVVERLEWLAGELEAAASWLDTKEEPRAAAYLLCAVR